MIKESEIPKKITKNSRVYLRMYFFVFLFKISFSFKFNQLLPKVNPINYKHRWKPKPLTVFQALEKAIQTKIAQRCYERFFIYAQ